MFVFLQMWLIFLFYISISSIYCRLRLSFSFRYLSGYLSFSKGSILIRPNPLVCMCLGSKQFFFLQMWLIFMCLVLRLDLCGGYSTLLIA